MIGLHSDILAHRYHADDVHDCPTLSSSIAKVLISDTPRHAWAKHPKLNPDYKADDDDKFNVGTVAHEVILGKGGGIDVHEFPDWRTKDAKQAKAVSRKNGRVPILAHQAERVDKLSTAVFKRVGNLASWSEAQSEVVAVWEEDGAYCRAMIDRLCDVGHIFDVKTSDNGLSDGAIARTIANLGYDLSAAFYVRGLAKLKPELSGRIKFFWVFAEVNEPHEVRIIEADNVTLHMGERKAAWAINKWRECMTRGEFPGYPPTIERIVYPAWAENSWLEREIKESEAA